MLLGWKKTLVFLKKKLLGF